VRFGAAFFQFLVECISVSGKFESCGLYGQKISRKLGRGVGVDLAWFILSKSLREVAQCESGVVYMVRA